MSVPVEFARPFPGPVRQYAYVLRDIDAAIARWVSVGVGPWFVLRGLSQPGTTYRGATTAPVLTLAMANTGDMQIELITQHDDQPSIYREFLASGRTGLHHVAYWTEDFDGTAAAAEKAGFGWAQRGEMASTRFGYFDGGPAADFVEVMELSETTGGMMTLIRQAADGWDGSDPVRSLG